MGVVEYGSRRLIVVIGVMLSALLQTLDTTITNVALPNIQGSLGASSDEGTWVINGYTIAVVIVIPMIPWLQTTFHRKRYFLACIAGFTAASFLCGISDSISELIFFRIVQGVFGAGLLATGQTILRDTFPPEQLATSQGIFAIGAIMGPTLGPPLGGFLVDNANWNWVFDINVAPGIVSFLILLAFLRDPETPARQPLDVFGLIYLVVGIGSLQYVLSEGERWDWFSDTNNLIFAGAAVVGIALLIRHELHAEQPLVDLRIFRYRAASAGFVLAMVTGSAIFGSIYTLPQLVQGTLNFTATLAGLLIFLRGIPIVLLTPAVAHFLDRIDARWFMSSGFAVLGFGNVLQAGVTTPVSGFGNFVLPLMLTGLGAVLLFIPLTTAVLAGVPRDQSARAAAYTNLGVQLGGSISIAALATVIARRTAFHLNVLAGAFVPGTPALATVPNPSAHAQEFLDLANAQATVLAFADSTLLIAWACFAAIPIVFCMPRGQRRHVVALPAKRQDSSRRSGTHLRVAAAALIIFAVPQSAQAQPDLAPPAAHSTAGPASIPILTQLANEPELHSYVAPVDVEATIHKLIFTFAIRRHGTAQFHSPDSLTISLLSVPARYTAIFGELGDIQTWPVIYDLEPLDDELNGVPAAFHLRGVPRQTSDVDHVLIESTDAGSPITATWYLRDGWTISATIQTEFVEQHLLPKHEIADIVGHGMKIHTELTFGDYTLNADVASPGASHENN